MHKPTVTSVYLTHPTTVHAYFYQTKLQSDKYSIFGDFLMDDMDCNIRSPMGKFWILPIITSAARVLITAGIDMGSVEEVGEMPITVN